MNLRLRNNVPFPIAVALLWLPFFVFLLEDRLGLLYDAAWYQVFTQFIFAMSFWFFAPVHLLSLFLDPHWVILPWFLAPAAQSGLLTLLLFYRRARRAARLRAEGEAARLRS